MGGGTLGRMTGWPTLQKPFLWALLMADMKFEPGPFTSTEMSCLSMLVGSPSRLSVGEQPEVTHDPYEFLQSPEPPASTKS